MKRFLALLLVGCTHAFSQSVSLSGSVRDMMSLAAIDSARVDIANTLDPSERYSVFTDPAGLWSFTVGIEEKGGLPSTFTLQQNYPNPFNPSTKITFTTARAGEVVFAVYTILGQLVERKSYVVEAGSHTVTWSSKGASGVLLYTGQFQGSRITRKMIQLDGRGSG